MKVLFLHGWHSVVGGVKPTYLSNAGHRVINPALDDDDFELAVQVAQGECDRHDPDVIVGSSRGGAVAMNLVSGDRPMVLLCPAWKNWGTVKQVGPRTVILHSKKDEVIPFEDSQELVANSDLPDEALLEVGRDHRLADEESLSVMLWACNLLGTGVPLPWAEEMVSRGGAGKAAPTSQEEASYVCDACGEEIVIPLDLTEGANQSYVEDCPVCCRANMIHVQISEEGEIRVWAEPEQDYD